MINAPLHRAVIVSVILTALPATAPAQPSAPDTLRLGALYEIASHGDPRHRQLRLSEEITAHTLASLAAARRPQLDLSARASYQTETASIPFDDASTIPFAFPTPPKDQYELAAEVGQLIYDGGRIAGEERLQQRRLAERSAEIRATLYSLRPEINSAFFAALLHQEQRAQLGIAAADLDARRELVAARVRDGAALPSDEAALEAELIYVRQRMSAAEAARGAALGRLELLIGRTVSEGDILAVPDLEHAASEAVEGLLERDASAGLAYQSRRPEFGRFKSARERAQAEAAVISDGAKPRLTAFARLALGRPGYDFFDESIRPYGIFGLRAQWTPFDWDATSRRTAAAALQADVIAADEAAFEARLRRDALDAVYAVERLEAVLASDAHAVVLRERVERAALRQLEEGILLAAEYVQKRNDVLEARLQQRTHRVELAEARVRLLTVLGIEIPTTKTTNEGLREPVAPRQSLTIDQPRPER